MNNSTIVMPQTKQVPNEYKQSPIGIIPVDWHIKPVGEAFRICNNLRLPISQEERNKIKGEYPYYGPTKIQGYIDNYRIEGKYALIGEDGDHFLKWKDLQMTLLVEGKFNVNNHAHIIQGVENLTEWFFYYFNHKELSPYLTRQGAGRYKLTKDSLSKIPCLLPPIEEQQKITQILSTWDKAIDTCRKTIEGLKVRNKGLSEKFLSGKIRLKGFEGESKNEFHVLGNYIKEVSVKNKDLFVKRVLSVTNSRGFINQSEQFEREVASADLTNYKIVKKGQFAYNPSRVNVGSLDLLRNFEEGILSPMYVVFETNNRKLLANFLNHHLKTYWFKGHIPMFVQGSVRDSLSFDGLCAIKFFIPSIEEQEAIASILDTANVELRQYEQKLQALQLQKKGLMQQLLTGKVRVKI